MEVLLYKT